ncbi:MAG: glycosyltransferase family 4 protein [Pseudomonadota bacterium]
MKTPTMKLGVVLKGYPRLSETFIAQEILKLQQAGLDLTIVSLRKPYDTQRHPIHAEITAPVIYLPEYLRDEKARVGNALKAARKLPGYKAARSMFLKDWARDRTRNRVRRFGQACVLAAEVADRDWLYGHFIHTPGSVTRYASTMLGLPYSLSAHAKDIWTSPDWELSEKLADARWTVTCTKGGAEHLAALAPTADKVRLVYHGLDLERFPSPDHAPSQRDGTGEAVRFLSVGRAVEKKGLDTLLDALALLPDDLSWHWTHIAGGPLLDDLRSQAARNGIDNKVTFLGKQAQTRVLAEYRDSDLFVLPCRIAADGDRDGLPNVIVEAQSQRLAVVSTPISGIPELIEDGANGALVEPKDAPALAETLERLARDPSMRNAMGADGETRVRHDFDAAREIDTLLDLFGVERT